MDFNTRSSSFLPNRRGESAAFHCHGEMEAVIGQLRPTSFLTGRPSSSSIHRSLLPLPALRRVSQRSAGLSAIACRASKNKTSKEATEKEIQKQGESELQLFSTAALPIIITALAEAESTGYSQASYYASLGLFVISFPGLYSLIKRSTKSKVRSNNNVQENGWSLHWFLSGK